MLRILSLLCLFILPTFTALADGIRCNYTLVVTGDPVHKLTRGCTIDHYYYVNSNNSDISYAYIKKGSTTYTVTIVDGKIKSISQDKF